MAAEGARATRRLLFQPFAMWRKEPLFRKSANSRQLGAHNAPSAQSVTRVWKDPTGRRRPTERTCPLGCAMGPVRVLDRLAGQVTVAPLVESLGLNRLGMAPVVRPRV